MYMPSQILHILFGEDVIAEIYRRIGARFGIVADKALEKIRQTYKNSFALGCQGPDIFYHNQMTRPVALEYGTLLHRRGYGVFTSVLLKMGLPDPPPDAGDIKASRRKKGISALGAYALGFMTHAILDRFCHPYIIYKSGWVVRKDPETRKFAGTHAFFERILDVLMLERLRGMEISSWDQECILAAICDNPPLGLKELLAKALVSAFPERAGRDFKLSQRMDNAFRDCAAFYRLTDPRKTTFRAAGGAWSGRGALCYVYPENFPLHIDYLNLGRESWFYPAADGEEDRRSFPDIYAAAVDAAAGALSPVIFQYLDRGIFPIKEAARGIGDGGLSIRDGEGKPCAPVKSRPLPLREILEEQRRLRAAGSV
jgi:hypothetical protein